MKQIITGRRWIFIICGMFGLMCGISLYTYRVSTAPQFPVMFGEPLIWRGENGTLFIRVRYKSAAPQRCLRQDVHLLRADDPNIPDVPLATPEDDDTTYVQFGAGMGGRNLQGSRYNYSLLRWLPSDFPAGPWLLITRLHYECEPFGLMSWEHTLPSVQINVPKWEKNRG